MKGLVCQLAIVFLEIIKNIFNISAVMLNRVSEQNIFDSTENQSKSPPSFVKVFLI